jgi:GntR family transcriptional regulator
MYKMLDFTLDPKSGVPFYKQIILQIEIAIADGRLKTGDQLPTVRGLAVDLSLNPNTVARAYNELEIRGIVTTQQGSGTFISDKQIEISEVERERILAELMRTCVSHASSYGFTIREIIDYLKDMENSPSAVKEEKNEIV